MQKNHQGGLSTAQLAKEYFAKVNIAWFAFKCYRKPLNFELFQLERWMVEALFQQYLVDFEMFGYSPQLYLNLAKMPEKILDRPWEAEKSISYWHKVLQKKSWRFSKSCAYCGKFSGFQMFVEMCENTHTRVSYCRIREVMQGFCWDAISARLYTKTQFGSSISEKIISLPFLCSISKSRWLRWSLRFWWDWDTLWYLFNSKCLINVSFIYEYNFYPSW